MLHAAAVADVESGATAVLLGPSGAGKTTLAATLGRRFGYLTDETAAIDDDLQVLPFPKPLSVLPASGARVKAQVSPDDLGLLEPGPAPYPVRALVLLDRAAHHEGPPVVEPVATIDALPWLAAQTSYSALLERPLHRLAAVAQAAGGVRRVTYAEAADLIPVVAALLAEER
jgi:ABC-type cobalamin/Fe3+-siderophores transport system ATPase subunit